LEPEDNPLSGHWAIDGSQCFFGLVWRIGAIEALCQ
jgi:hypothetical protein